MKKFLATAIVVAVFFSCKLSVNAAELDDIFSAKYYADTYEDLYAAFEYDEAKLFKHVREYGLKEKRDISPILDVVYYRETYPDLNAAFGDDWDAYVNHWFECGIKEGRDNGTNFDIIRYVNSYADLREAFDEDYEALANHYLTYGMNENRVMALKPQVSQSVATPSTAAPVEPSVPTDVVHEYNEDGTISKTYVYAPDGSGELLGTIEYEYNEDGLIEQSDMYDADGTFMGSLSYEYNQDGFYTETHTDENNAVLSKTTYDATTHNQINFIVYDNNGNVDFIEEYTYTDNRMSSKKTTWSNGIYTIDEYDIVTGLCTKCTEYDANGNAQYVTELFYEGNVEVSRKFTNLSDGTYRIEEFNDGYLERITYYDANGLKLYTTVFTNGEVTETIYYDSEGNIIP